MKIRFGTGALGENLDWIVDYKGAIRIVTPRTHEYIISIYPVSDGGHLILPVNNKDVYIDIYGQINITGWEV